MLMTFLRDRARLIGQYSEGLVAHVNKNKSGITELNVKDERTF